MKKKLTYLSIWERSRHYIKLKRFTKFVLKSNIEINNAVFQNRDSVKMTIDQCLLPWKRTSQKVKQIDF